jgi:hypothetical protein
MTFGDRGLKLKYSSSADTEPNNFPYFCVIGYSSLSQNAVPSNNIIQATMSVDGKFTDA